MMETFRAWVGRSFRNRIFVAMLAATLLPLLVCGGLMLNLQVTRSQESLAQESHAQLAALGGALDDFRDACRDIARTLSDSTVVRSALRRGGEDSRTLYQVLFRTAESLRPYARFDIYDQQGVCRYTTASTPPLGERDPGWGILWDAGQEEGLALRAGEDGGLVAAPDVQRPVQCGRRGAAAGRAVADGLLLPALPGALHSGVPAGAASRGEPSDRRDRGVRLLRGPAAGHRLCPHSPASPALHRPGAAQLLPGGGHSGGSVPSSVHVVRLGPQPRPLPAGPPAGRGHGRGAACPAASTGWRRSTG